MILRKEILEKSKLWVVPPDTVDKDYVLGHVLSGIQQQFGNRLIFKGGTCLRKCYFPEYRFSEDLDFTSANPNFILYQKELDDILADVTEHTRIQFVSEDIKDMLHKDRHMGFQVDIKYWGAYHDRNEVPPPAERWTTRIKLEISTEELLVTKTIDNKLHHPYSDTLISPDPVLCYSLDEVIAEKLRSLIQRKYTAPRDFYDLYYLTKSFAAEDWNRIKPIFIRKIEHKGITYEGPGQLIDDETSVKALKAWKASLAHQITGKDLPPPEEIVSEVNRSITTYL